MRFKTNTLVAKDAECQICGKTKNKVLDIYTTTEEGKNSKNYFVGNVVICKDCLIKLSKKLENKKNG